MKLEPKNQKMNCDRCGVPMKRKQAVNAPLAFYTCTNDNNHCEIREVRVGDGSQRIPQDSAI